MTDATPTAAERDKAHAILTAWLDNDVRSPVTIRDALVKLISEALAAHAAQAVAKERERVAHFIEDRMVDHECGEYNPCCAYAQQHIIAAALRAGQPGQTYAEAGCPACEQTGNCGNHRV